MPGLFGILMKREPGDEAPGTMARQMAGAMWRLPWLRRDLRVSDRFGAGRVHVGGLQPGSQPLRTADGEVEIWIDGELFLPGGEAITAGRAAALLDTPESLREADGVFAVARYDRRSQELVLATDRLGYRPLFVVETDHWFAYAAEIKSLLAIQPLPRIDDVAVREFFGFDHLLGDRTWWRGIDLLPPASMVRVSPRGRTDRRYWTFGDLRRDPRPAPEVREELDRLWPRLVARHSRPGTMPLLLSGGQDSRLLLAELRDQHADVVAVTCGEVDSPDMRIARICAPLAGVEHRACTLGPDTWWHRREEAIWQTDGLASAFHFHVAIAADEMHTGTCYSPMNVAADLLFGGSHLSRRVSAEWPGTDLLLRERAIDNPFFTAGQVIEASRPDARAYAEGPTSDCFHLLQRVRRFTLLGPGCLSAHVDFAFPSLSRELIALALAGLTDDERRGHRFYNSWLLQRHPRFYADVPWQATGRGLRESTWTRVRRSGRNRVRRLAGRAVAPVSRDGWFVDYAACIRISGLIGRLARADLLVDSVLGGRAREALIHADVRPLSVANVLGIYTLETYLRQVAGLPAVDSAEQPSSAAAAVAREEVACTPAR